MNIVDALVNHHNVPLKFYTSRLSRGPAENKDVCTPAARACWDSCIGVRSSHWVIPVKDHLVRQRH